MTDEPIRDEIVRDLIARVDQLNAKIDMNYQMQSQRIDSVERSIAPLKRLTRDQ